MRWHALQRWARMIGYRLMMLRWRLGIETKQDRERAERFHHALAALSEIDRAIFLMARLDDLSFAEISLRLGVPMPGVHARFAHALEQIARTLAD